MQILPARVTTSEHPSTCHMVPMLLWNSSRSTTTWKTLRISITRSTNREKLSFRQCTQAMTDLRNPRRNTIPTIITMRIFPRVRWNANIRSVSTRKHSIGSKAEMQREISRFTNMAWISIGSTTEPRLRRLEITSH